MTPLFPISEVIDLLIYYDGARLFVAKASDGSYFLCLNVEQDEGGSTWLYAPITLIDYVKVKSNRVYFGEFFKKPLAPYLLVVRTKEMHLDISHAVKVATEHVPAEWLPMGDLEDQRELFTDGETIQAGPTMLPGLVQTLVGVIEKILPPLELSAQRTARPVTDLRFVQGRSSSTHVIPATVLGQALQTVQHLVESVAQALEGGPTRRGRIGEALRDKVRLDAVAAFPSSFGIRLEARDGSFVADSLADKVFERFLAVLSTRDDTAKLRNELRPLGPRVAAHYKAFLKALATNSIDLEIGAAIPGDIEARRAEIKYDEAYRICQILDKEGALEAGVIPVDGTLVGLSLKSKYFRIEAADAVYSGKISDECLTAIGRRATVGDMYHAKIGVKIEIKGYSGEEEERYELIKLSPMTGAAST